MRTCASAAIAAASSVSLAGCVQTPAQSSSARIVVTDRGQLSIGGLRAEARKAGLSVHGEVARRSMIRGKVWGHLHVEAWNGPTLLAWDDASLDRLRKDRLPVQFNAFLPVAANSVQEIRISHVIISDRSRASQDTIHD